jgi:CRP/FNR family nitrogen fixation transcriptional regulator
MLTHPHHFHSRQPSKPAPYPALDQFGAVTGHAGLIATEFSYKEG